MAGPLDFMGQLLGNVGQMAQQQGGGQGGGGAPPPTGASPQTGMGAQQPSNMQPMPDLAQMYLQLAGNERMSQGLQGLGQAMFNMGNAVWPGRQVKMQQVPHEQNLGELMQNFVQLQQYQRQQQAIAAFPKALKAIMPNASDEEVNAASTIAAADPHFMETLAASGLGLSGGPAWQAQVRAERGYAARGQTPPWTPGDPVSYNAYSGAKAQADEAHAKDLQAFKDSGVEDFPSVDQKLTKNENTVGTLLKNMPATMAALQAPEFLTTGKLPGYLPGGGPYGQDVKNAANAINTLKAELSSEGLRNVKNVRNVREFNTLGSAMTNALDASNSPDQVQTALENIQKGFTSAHAQAYAVAGKQVPYSYKGLVDPRYLTRGGPYDTGATQEEAPDDGAASSSGGTGTIQKLSDAGLAKVKAALAAGGDRASILQHLKAQGFDTSGL